MLRKEDVLHGRYLDRAPDLLLEPAPLYSLTHARQIVEPADWLSGDHRPEGVYVAAGPGIAAGAGEEISLADFAGWIESSARTSRSRPAPTRPSSRRWAYSRTTRSARSRSGSAVSAISTDRGAGPQRGLPGHQPCGRHSRESTPSRTAAARNSTNNEITITAPMAHHPFQVCNGGDRRPVRNTMPT